MMPPGIAGIPDILSGLATEISQLLHTEIRLAQSEVSDKIDAVALASIPAAVGFAIAIPALTVLLFAAGWALVTLGLSTALSFLIVGIAACLVAGILIQVTVTRLKGLNLNLRRTGHQIGRDVELVKYQVNAS